MKKLERVRRMTFRRMEQIDCELERFEERPELDTRRRFGSLLKRFDELESSTTSCGASRRLIRIN
jgi:hypothetical protein